MKKTIKKSLAVVLSMVTLISSFVFTGFAEDREYDVGNGVVIESYICENDDCDFNWTLYENGLMVVGGDTGGHYIVTDNIAKKIFIDKTSKNIQGSTFYYVEGTENFSVSKNNSFFTTENGVLLNSDKTTIIAYPQAKKDVSFDIPSTVKRIDHGAFYKTKLKSITIPSNVSYVGIAAFCSSSLESVNFEGGERKLVIASEAFYKCGNLKNISLFGNRVYALASDAFNGTVFYNDSANWENGVLYLNDILVCVDYKTIGEEYTIKDGTTTIADAAMFIYSPTGEYKDAIAVNVNIPESVDNIGIATIFSYDRLPENIFRLGSAVSHGEYYDSFNVAMSSQFEESYMSILNKYGCSLDDKDNLPLEVKIELGKKGFFFSTYCGWTHMTLPASDEICGVVFVDDGIVGIADNSFPYLFYYLQTYVHLFPYYYNGLILPESFKILSGQTELCDDYVNAFEVYESDTEKSVTFLNKDCFIYDDENTLWDGYTICGYKGSTAEAYANKYNRKFVAIDECTHEQTSLNAHIAATCASDGFSGDVYCQYCGKFLEEGTILPKTDEHDFEKKETLTNSTCNKSGTAKYVCKTCGKEEIMPEGEPLEHYFLFRYELPSTCKRDGFKYYQCIYCGSEKTVITQKATGHKDENDDGYCDNCNENISPEKNCPHICHKGGISKILYKIALIFWKMFRTNKTCSCGVAHY